MRLLLAVHLNDSVDVLLAEAVRWATRMSATLDLAYVDEYQYNAYLVEDPAVRAVLDAQWVKIHDQSRERLEALQQRVPDGIRGHALFLSGRAPDEIVTAGNERDAILIGTHGRRGFSHLLLGSVAERVVRTAAVPVMVLHLPST